MIRKLLDKWLQPTAIVFTGLGRGQQPHVSIHYGRLLLLGFDLPTTVDVESIQERVMEHAFTAAETN